MVSKGSMVAVKTDGDALYVSPAGDDRWSGRLAEAAADGSDGPLRSIAAAQGAVRRLVRAGLRKPVTVYLRGGTHFLAETLAFGPQDSGTAKCPVVWTAQPGEAPVVSGGRRISGFRTQRIHGRECLVATLPEVAQGRWHFTQLFVNGERRWRPRLPKEGYYRFAGIGEIRSRGGLRWMHGPDRATFAPGEIKPWKNLDEVELTTYQLWFDTHHRIKRLDPKRNIVHFHRPSIGSLRDEKNLFARYFVENVFEALREPGQWYLDRRSGTLYYLPQPDEDPESLEVIAPALTTLVRFCGRGGRPVRHVRLENLSLRHAEFRYGLDEVGWAQAAITVPGAIVMEGAEACVLYNCEVSQIAQYAIEVRPGSRDNRIVACRLHDAGAGGVKIGCRQANRGGSLGSRGAAAHQSMRTTVSDCTIHDVGKIYPSAIGIWVGNSGRNRILHNHIFDVPYTGISCGWTWGYSPTFTVDNRIEYNHIHHINSSRRLSDNGGIYTLGVQPGSTIRGNHIHDVGCYGYGGWGIYPDEGSSQFVIEDNVVYRTDGPGFFSHYGRDNVVRNNIFAMGGKEQVAPFGRPEPHRTDIFRHNVVYWSHGRLWEGDWSADHSLFEDNLFWRTDGQPFDFARRPLAYWQSRGQLRGTVIADPLFADPAAGDFSLRADSPALAMGFRPIDVGRVGPRRLGRRPHAFADFPVPVEEAKEIVHTTLEIVKPLVDAGGVPGRVRFTAWNVGEVPASGAVRLRVLPEGAGRIVGQGHFAFSLRPGASKSAEFAVTAAEDAEKIIVETVPRGRGLVPSFVIETKPADSELCLSRVGRISSLRELDERLAAQEARPVMFADQPIADIKLALAGNDLAIVARVHDRCIAPNETPWQGSCVEVFAAMPARKNPGGAGIGQVFLVPGVRRRAAQGLYRRGEPVAAPDVRIETSPANDGYFLRALVPLKYLLVNTSKGRFLLEIKITVIPDRCAGLVRATLFNSIEPSSNIAGMGLAKLT